MTGVGSELAGTTRRRLSLECYDPSRGHDKVYHLVLQEIATDAYDVYAYWGRRGSTLQNQKKGSSMKRYSADILIDKLFNEKAGKGYKVVSDENFKTAPAVAIPNLNSWDVDDDELEEIEVDETPERTMWTARDFARNPVQPKVEPGHKMETYVAEAGTCIMVIPAGERILFYANASGAPEAFNGRGAKLDLPEPMLEDLIDLEGPLALDGVWTGSEYIVFDAPEPEVEYQDRYNNLFALLEGTVGPRVRVADVAFSDAEKDACLRAARDANASGIWVRDGKVDNHPGQQDSHWQQYNFSPRAFLVVMSLNGKCSLGVDDGLGLMKVAEVGKLGDEVAEEGAIVEVEYESWPGHGKLMQAPRVLGKRPDVTIERCNVEQLAVH
jgi:hypothetical protein